MAEIKSLFGHTIPNQPAVPEVVEALEDILVRAKRGDVRGFALAYVDSDMCSCDRVVKGDSKNILLAGAIAGMSFSFHTLWHENYTRIEEHPDDGPAA